MNEKLHLIMGFILLTSCGATKDSSGGDRLRDYEATFRPSDYDLPLGEVFTESHLAAATDSGTTTVLPAPPPELTQGYRVQLFATTGYDEAMQLKAIAEGQFTDEWFYVVYDAPTYKVRAGNFLERYEADRFAKLLAERGYKDSWVVPERVYVTPPPRPPQPQEGQNQPK